MVVGQRGGMDGQRSRTRSLILSSAIIICVACVPDCPSSWLLGEDMYTSTKREPRLWRCYAAEAMQCPSSRFSSSLVLSPHIAPSFPSTRTRTHYTHSPDTGGPTCWFLLRTMVRLIARSMGSKSGWFGAHVSSSSIRAREDSWVGNPRLRRTGGRIGELAPHSPPASYHAYSTVSSLLFPFPAAFPEDLPHQADAG